MNESTNQSIMHLARHCACIFTERSDMVSTTYLPFIEKLLAVELPDVVFDTIYI